MITNAPQLATEATVRDLVAAKVIDAVTVAPVLTGNGYQIGLRFGDAERCLGNARGAVKVFASLDTAAEQLRRLGISDFSVKTAGFKPGRVRGPRPDRAEALRQTVSKAKPGSKTPKPVAGSK